MSAPELSRPIKPRALPAGVLRIEASEGERAALAHRFGVTALHALVAEVSFDEAKDAVLATGTLSATIEQPCAISGEDFTYAATEPLSLRFVPEASRGPALPDEEVELGEDDLDEIAYAGDSFDLGEALAQTLALAIDPYREGPGADEARAKAGIVSDEEMAPSGPLAEALAKLRPPA